MDHDFDITNRRDVTEAPQPTADPAPQSTSAASSEPQSSPAADNAPQPSPTASSAQAPATSPEVFVAQPYVPGSDGPSSQPYAPDGDGAGFPYQPLPGSNAQPQATPAAASSQTPQPDVVVALPYVPDVDAGASGPRQQPQPKQRNNLVWKVLGFILAGFLAVNLLSGFIALSLLSLAVASCARSCSDAPVQDSRANSAFISDRTTNERDLATFDALRGSIQARHDRITSYANDDEAKPISVDELRAEIAAGSWPDDSAGYDDVDRATSPQLWVRIAELSQDCIEEATGEQWAVVDFAYPFPTSGPVPVMPTRDESDYVETLLVCQTGEDAGLYATVDYWRWEDPARFEEHVAEARARRDEATSLLAAVGQVEGLANRELILADDDVYVWEQGEDDPLLDPETFVAVVNEVGQLTGSYSHLVLLAGDTPIALRYNCLSSEYPNSRETQILSLEACRDLLLNSDRAYSLDFAQDDMLLNGYRTTDEECTADDLLGVLSPSPQVDYKGRWNQPDEDSVFDASLATKVRDRLGSVDESQVIAISKYYSWTYEGQTDVDLYAWAVVPRGAVPEDPRGFCDTVNSLRDDLWESFISEHDGTGQRMLYVRLYVIDPDTIMRGGEPSTFEELREATMADVASMDEFSFDVMLCGKPYASHWQEDEEPTIIDCDPGDVGGTISRTREWHNEVRAGN